MTETREMPRMYTRAAIQPETIDVEKRTVEVIFSTGAKVRRGFWEPYEEILSMDPKHVRMKRLNDGAPLLNAHRAFSNKDVIGVVESAKIENKTGYATVRFSQDEDADKIYRKVREKVLRSVSVGYDVHKYEDITEDKKNALQRFRAIDWEPLEISVVPIGADPDAQIRAENQDTHSVTIIARSSQMPDKNIDNSGAASPPVAPKKRELTKEELEKIEREAVEKHEKRRAEIQRACRAAKLPEEFERKVLDSKATVDEARQQILDEWVRIGETIPGQRGQVEIENDCAQKRMAGMADALLHRFDMERYPLPDKSAGREMRSMSLLEMCKRCLDWQGVDYRVLDSSQIATRALSTSDFPLVLENVLRKTLRTAYEETPQTFEPFTRRTQNPDFKQISRIQLGESPQLKKVVEGGEITTGSITEAAEKYALATYARNTILTRQAIINDDLSAFTRIPQGFGIQARHLESDLVWGVITDNENMADANALFSAAHSNLAAGGNVGAIADTTITAAYTAMMRQVGLDGLTKLRVMPKYLVVPVTLRAAARKFVAQNLIPAAHKMKPAKASDVNIYTDLGVIEEPRLDDNSTDAWYLFSDKTVYNDLIELANLSGQTGPMIETFRGPGVDGWKVQIVYDLAAKAIDWRPFYKNPGA